MKVNYDKVLVISTFSFLVGVFIIIFWVNLIIPKKLDTKNALSFGNEKSTIELIVFEDFKCKYCKEFVNDIFPEIKKLYVDTNKISYKMLPIAFIFGSRPIATAAIAIYELKKDSFFDFIKIVSDNKNLIETKQDLIEIAKNFEGMDIKTFKEYLDKDIYSGYLKTNILYLKTLLKSKLQVPTFFLNGQLVDTKKIKSTIDEYIKLNEN